MGQEASEPNAKSWRVVLFTNIGGGLVYHLVSQVMTGMGHKLVGVVTSPGPAQRRSEGYRDVVAAVPPGIDLIVSNHPRRWAAMLEPMRPDVIIVGGLPWRIPDDVIALPRYGAINMHPSILPRHRGPSPMEAVFGNDDAETGFTIHRITPDFDTGPILAQVRIPVVDDDDADSLLGKMAPQLPQAIAIALSRLAAGDPGDPQDESLATYAGMPDPAGRTIDWSRPARSIHNQVRSWRGIGASGLGALGALDGSSHVISKTRLLSETNAATTDAAPGTVLERREHELIVQCGDGPLAIVAWSPITATSNDVEA